ncbi:hypothetical protein Cni_G02308 [Canna indica]|uniref:Uncharacterized protein n=1 Tax=Canna indica TaxID=4628 RepID=A0AAQ3PZY6_9LILI|nr:hypothetical protein Cni_G02308 [Canna indica]
MKEIVLNDDCSDILVVNDSMAIAGHNKDATIALVVTWLPNGLLFTAYMYAGELPSCAYGFNSNGIVEEIIAGDIGRNLISRDLLEATHLEDALDVTPFFHAGWESKLRQSPRPEGLDAVLAGCWRGHGRGQCRLREMGKLGLSFRIIYVWVMGYG